MDKQQLRETLERANVREDCYDLDGGHLPERYTLRDSCGCWSVYYSERGLESGLKQFWTESSACEHLLRELLDDPTTRQERK